MILERVYESKFVFIEISAEKQFLNITWSEETSDTLDKEYRSEVHKLVHYLNAYKPKYALDDAR